MIRTGKVVDGVRGDGCRTLQEIQVELDARGIKMSRMGVFYALKRAEMKLRVALEAAGIDESILLDR